jgi:hypothetical protein
LSNKSSRLQLPGTVRQKALFYMLQHKFLHNLRNVLANKKVLYENSSIVASVPIAAID